MDVTLRITGPSAAAGLVPTAICRPLESISSKGIWLRDNPLDYPFPLVMAQVSLVLLTSRALYYLLRPLGQTKFVCNLLGGIILGPSLIGHKKVIKEKLFRDKDTHLFETISFLGVLYSMFLIAVKFETNMLRRTAKNAWKIGLLGFLVPLAVSLGLVHPIGSTLPGLEGGMFVYFSFSSLSFTFFPVIAQALNELNLMTSELGQLAMSSALVTEAIQWLSVGVHIVFTQKSPIHGILALVSLFALTVLICFIVRPLILLIIKNTPQGKEVKEVYVVAILLGVLVSAGISDALGATPLTGPLLLGLVIPDGPPLGATLIQKTEFLVSELFLPVLFFRVGFMTDVYSFQDWGSLGKLQMVILLIYGAKIVTVTVAAVCCKIRFKNSFLLSLIMNIKGIIDLVVFSRWRFARMLDQQSYTQIVLSMLLVTLIETPVVRFLYQPQIRLEPSSKHSRTRNIQSPRYNSDFSILCCVHNEESVRNITSLLESSNPTEQSPILAYVVRAVELIGRAVPLLLPYKKKQQQEGGTKKLKRTNTPTHQLMQAFWNYSKNSKGPVSIHAFTMIAPYNSMHETVCRLAEDNNIPLILLPFHENNQYTVGSNVMAGIRQFNVNVQTYSPCTVGILVERGLPARLTVSHFSYNVGVFFIGGPDDREALAYASRMSGNPDVGITVFRIILRNKLKEGNTKEEEVEEMLDESLVDEFKIRNLGNDCVIWKDIEVDDSVQIMDAIRNSQGDYDLVLVGRRHSEMSLRDEEMAEFVQNAELGVVGDMLASVDFCGGMVNVLVLQENVELGNGAFRANSEKRSAKWTKVSG
ncbi:PREDICTED: cation/H(+) antiporter 15-like [Prunus mume]|uniref:Cation/H(+) antiporter 15-like n=1 Tax=Prunus mume TaxID=102107 RepID=A0ABM0P413_PRUMU|nr:PREDICTED: cation/H(+) antiporter 15-like [Prunus mume]